MSEFTGERLVPGAVDADLWNEHISRYAFAASLCLGHERVLDAGCGTGYGARFLSGAAGSVLGIDCSADAVGYATRHYRKGRSRFAVALCEALPVEDKTVDLVVAFEVIEHLAAWRSFLEECRRVLADKGRLIVSTPNKSEYAESRADAGPNPFHVHEFEFSEFAEELGRVFPFVRVFGQNHSAGIVFANPESEGATVQFASTRAEPEHAGYFVAVCGTEDSPDIANFVFVPEAANVLRERERHIRLLDSDLAALHDEHVELVTRHRDQKAELERSNQWAESLDRESKFRADRIVALQQELAEEQARAQAELLALQTLADERTAWAQSRDGEVERCVEHLHAAEAVIEERTKWAQTLESRCERVDRSRWTRIGRSLRLSPPPG